MSRKWKEFSGIALLKWAALFAVAFVLSLPVTAETGFAANNYTVTVASGYLALRNAKAYDFIQRDRGTVYRGYCGCNRFKRIHLLDCLFSKAW